MFKHPPEIGIIEISKEEYLQECEGGLEILSIATPGDSFKIDSDNLLMVSMSEKGKDIPYVSYAKLGNCYIFTRGYPWTATPLEIC